MEFDEAKEIMKQWYKCHVPVIDLKVNYSALEKRSLFLERYYLLCARFIPPRCPLHPGG